jgi:hypothetical protein
VCRADAFNAGRLVTVSKARAQRSWLALSKPSREQQVSDNGCRARSLHLRREIDTAVRFNHGLINGGDGDLLCLITVAIRVVLPKSKLHGNALNPFGRLGLNVSGSLASSRPSDSRRADPSASLDALNDRRISSSGARLSAQVTFENAKQ